MADPQEYTSIDELFRKTFDDLPDSPSPSGWDAPSPKVWDQVQVRIKPPHSGWTTKSILLVSGLAIALMLGLYWSLSQPSAPAVADAPQTSVAAAPTAPALPPASSEQAQAAAPENTEAATPERRASAATPKAARKVAPSIAAAGNPQVQEERPSDDSLRRRPSGSAPLPGTNPNMPNTTVRRQVEAWRKAPWAQPLAPLPTILEMQVVHPVPPALKNLVQPTH